MTNATRNIDFVVNAVAFGDTREGVNLLIKAAKHFVNTGEHVDGFEDLIEVETLKGYNPNGSDRHIIRWA